MYLFVHLDSHTRTSSRVKLAQELFGQLRSRYRRSTVGVIINAVLKALVGEFTYPRFMEKGLPCRFS